eukprot:7663658-Pyramimonas_sp.AAC.2
MVAIESSGWKSYRYWSLGRIECIRFRAKLVIDLESRTTCDEGRLPVRAVSALIGMLNDLVKKRNGTCLFFGKSGQLTPSCYFKTAYRKHPRT